MSFLLLNEVYETKDISDHYLVFLLSQFTLSSGHEHISIRQNNLREILKNLQTKDRDSFCRHFCHEKEEHLNGE